MLRPLVLSHDFGGDFLVPIESSLLILNHMLLKADRSYLNGHLLPNQVLRKKLLTVCLKINAAVLHLCDRRIIVNVNRKSISIAGCV